MRNTFLFISGVPVWGLVGMDKAELGEGADDVRSECDPNSFLWRYMRPVKQVQQLSCSLRY